MKQIDPYTVFRVIQAVYLTAAVFVVLVATIQFHPIITGDVLLDDEHILSKSQMTAWILWMNTVFIFGLGCIIFATLNKWMRKKEQ